MRSRKSQLVKIGIVVTAAICCTSRLSAVESEVTVTESAPDVATEQSSGISLFTRNPLHLTLSLDGGYDTNVGTGGQQGSASAFTDGRGTLVGAFGDERANLTIDSGLEVIYFTDQVSGPNPEVNTHGGISGAYAISQRLGVTAHVSAAYQAEPDFSANIGPDQRVGYFFTTNDDVSASFQWFNPLSTVTSASIMVVKYDDSTIGLEQDRHEETIGQQVRWALARGTLVGEYRFQRVDYDTDIGRNSDSHYALGGIDYPFNERVNVTLRGGATFRFFDDGTERTSPRAEGTLNYLLGRTSALTCNVSYGLEEPDSPLFKSRTTFRGGLQLKYWLTRHLLSTFSGYYSNSDNQTASGVVVNGSSNEETYSVSAGLQYSFTSRWGVHAGFDYSGVSSGTTGGVQDYSRERYTGGVVVNF